MRGELRQEALGLRARPRAGRPSPAPETGSPAVGPRARTGAPAAPPRPARTRARSWPAAALPARARAHPAPRAGTAPGNPPTAVRRSRRCRTAAARRVLVALQAHERGAVGEQSQIATGAERVRLHQRPERGEGVVGGHPAHATIHICAASSADGSERPLTMPARSQHTRATSSMSLKSPPASLVVPDCLPQAQRGHALPRPLGVVGRHDREHPTLGHVAPLHRRGQPLAGL